MKYLIAVISLLMAAGTVFAAPKYAEKQEFVESIVGRKISSKTAKGNPFTATFKGNGTGEFQQKGKKKANFKWTVQGNTVCWDFGDFKECNKIEIVSPAKANFYDAKTGKLNNAYDVE